MQNFCGRNLKTATGGEISVLDPGGYGTLTVTKAITVDGGTGSGWGSTLFSSVNGFIINITTGLTSDKVILRNLSINGAGTTLGVDGIRFLDGQQLTVEHVRIFNFSGDGIEVNQSQGCNLFLKDVKITHGGIGIKTASSAGTIAGTMRDVDIDAMSSHGFQAVSATLMALSNVSVARCAGDGIRSDAANTNVIVENSTVLGNNFGFNEVAGNLRIANCGMFHNNTNLNANVASAGDNRSSGNTTTNVPTPGGFTIN